MSRRAVADRMAGAAADLLDALDDEQRAVAAWPFPADEERRRWFYTPVDHGGLPLGEMRPRQQQRAMRLLSTGLSAAGFVTASTIVGLENVLDAVERFRPFVGPRASSRPGAVLRAHLRTARGRRDLGLALRRAPRVRQPHHRRRRRRLVDPVLPRRQPGVVDPPRATPAASARRRRGPRARAGALARRRAVRQGADLAGGARRPGHHEPSRRRPGAHQRRRGRAGPRPHRRPAGGPACPARRLRAAHPRRPRRR